MARPKIIFLRSVIPHTTAWYYSKAFKGLPVDVVDMPFDPHDPPGWKEAPAGDLLLLVDCGLPVDFPFLGEYKGPKGYVSIDSCHKLSIHRAYCEKYRFDFVWVAQKHVVAGFGEKARWLPLGADPETHVYRPQIASADSLWERLTRRSHYDIGMCGAPYKHRRAFEKLFRKAGLTTNFYFRKRFGAEATRELARSTIGFNVGAGFDGVKGKDVNMRVFETMANGQCMLLTNTYDGLGFEDLFEEGSHYIGFRSEEEATDKALYYSRHQAEAIRIAAQGQRHILENHTYAHRCEEIIRAIR